MKVRVIFLDIDGVLNFSEHIYTQLRKRKSIDFSNMQFNDLALKYLSRLVNDTNSKVVLSSSWRKERSDCTKLKNLTAQLNRVGVDIFSHTPVLDTDNINKISRGQEIKEWLINNRHLNISNFVILDDRNDMEDMHSNLVKCSWEYGFTSEELYKKAYKILTEDIFNDRQNAS